MAGFFKKLFTKFSRSSRIDWEELEAELVAADIGIRRAMGIADQLKESKGLDAENLVESTREVLRRAFPSTAPSLPVPPEGKPLVILVVGVNGTGKTTSAAKLAHLLQKQGSRVCYEAHTQTIREGFQYLICDTAGRLHTRHNLMEELSKIRRTLAKQDASAPHSTLLVVDATTGANALAQAREFHKATPLDSVIITKMDGSGKGGVAVAIMDEMHISPSFLGTGEGAEDFEPFNRDRYVDSLL